MDINRMTIWAPDFSNGFKTFVAPLKENIYSQNARMMTP